MHQRLPGGAELGSASGPSPKEFAETRRPLFLFLCLGFFLFFFFSMTATHYGVCDVD
jgi:hypothetical protein